MKEMFRGAKDLSSPPRCRKHSWLSSSSSSSDTEDIDYPTVETWLDSLSSEKDAGKLNFFAMQSKFANKTIKDLSMLELALWGPS